MPTLSSLVAPQVVIMTTCYATNNDKVGIMATLTISEWLSMNNRVPVKYPQYGYQEYLPYFICNMKMHIHALCHDSQHTTIPYNTCCTQAARFKWLYRYLKQMATYYKNNFRLNAMFKCHNFLWIQMTTVICEHNLDKFMEVSGHGWKTYTRHASWILMPGTISIGWFLTLRFS